MRNQFLIATLLFLSLDAYAKGLEKAVAAMRVGDYAEAYYIMRPFAEAGDAEAQYNIGWMYLNGYGLRSNVKVALQWWEQASKQGYADASFSIGMLYSLGDGKVAKDLDKAIDYYLLAAEDGQEDAVTALQAMILRNDDAIRSRMHSIIQRHGSSFGEKRLVKANKLNARNGPSVEDKVITRYVKGQTVLEMFKQGKWSQVVLLDDEKIDRCVWVYNPLLENITMEASSSN